MREELKRVDVSSPDLILKNIAKLKELFPEVITEGKIDFDKLRLVLGDEIEDSPERYNFSWNGKKQAMKLAQQSTTATLKPNKKKSKNWDDTQNIYIEGDNLEVLKLLQKSYSGKVKMIFIDPPYNTGNDFIYKDNFRNSVENYLKQTEQIDDEGHQFVTNLEQNGRFHTKWLNMMYPRLKLARNLLADEGVAFITIDDTEVSNLKKMCDEIFGEKNSLYSFIWESRTSISNDHPISLNHNHILVYAKSLKKLKWQGNPLDSAEYSNPDNDPRGPWKLTPIDANKTGGATVYPIKNPKTGKEYFPPSGRIWAFNKERFQKLYEDGRIKFGLSDRSAPKRKLFLQERTNKDDSKTPSSLIKDVGTTKQGTEELTKIFEQKIFDYPKPISLIKKLLIHGCLQDNDLVLDFFSGSATTAHATMQLNREDGINRRFIMVQLPEKLDKKNEIYQDGYHTICDIGQERLRRVGAKMEDNHVENDKKLDSGFKVFELQKSNFKKWDFATETLGEQIEFLANNLEPDATQLDLVYEIMLKQGMDLSLLVENINFKGANIYKVGSGTLFVVLGNDVTSNIANKILEMIKEDQSEDASVVLQDTSFFNDSEKLNLVENLSAGGLRYENILSV
ncbi:MAG: site-specific DNA-methyltransferase [Atopostipes suicloacalis]|nr:site-specific DNA-methyltransferase [Atopostipes sp.]MDN6731338.1 site-specific DNA-methyltransferase [Atopostipes suicloacalis]